MDQKLNIGILGCASIAKKYAIKAFQSLDLVDQIFIASRDHEKSKALSHEFGIKSHASYDDLINNKNIHAVYIPLPIGLHETWAIKAAKAGKHILCEKSLSHSLASTRKIIDACKKNKVVLFENFMCDYHPQHAQVLSLINSNEIGTPITFKGYFGFPAFHKDNFRNNKRLGGGSLNDAGAYTLFMARKILGGEPLTITCQLEMDKKTGVDTRGSAFLTFKDNKTAFISFGFDNVYQNNYSVWGSKGLVTVQMAYSIPPQMEPSIELYKNENLQATTQKIQSTPANHFELIFKDFCETILKKDSKKMQEKYSQILLQAKALEAMRRSSKKNKVISLKTITR